MAAEVSSPARMLGRYVEEKREAESDSTRELVTRDFLGGGGCFGAGGGVKELDLHLAAPAGWERRLDLKSGELFLQRSGYATTAAGVVSNHTDRDDRSPPPLLPLFPSPSLDLGLVPPAPMPTEYQSVCTLDKVKSALDRLASAAPANKPGHANRSGSGSYSASVSQSRTGSGSCSRSESLSRPGSSTSSSTTASSLQGQQQQQQKRKQRREGGESGTTTEEDGGEAEMIATGCPSCLSYVLITRSRPRCPRCAAHVPTPATKKPRLDLNLNSSSSAA